MLKIFKIILASAILISSQANGAELKNKKILISQTVDHPAINATTKGIVDSLKSAGYDPKGIRIESAQANGAIAAQIASKFVNQKPDIVVGVATTSAQSLAKYAKEGKVRLVFSTVTDPLSAGLVEDLDAPSNNIFGVSNFVDIEPQLELFKKLQPDLRRLGIIYNPGEINSISIIKKLEILCPKFGIELVKQTVTKTSDVPQNTTKLAKAVDAIFISNDNTALSSIQSIIKIANDTKIPVYVSDTDAVVDGAVAALGPNQYEVGKQTGRMIIKLLEGKNFSAMKVEFPEKTDLYINLVAAKKVGINIPDDIKNIATNIIRD